MKRSRRLSLIVGRLLAAASVLSGGCTAFSGGDGTDGMQLKEPDSKFFKQVERDPFPRADAVPAARR